MTSKVFFLVLLASSGALAWDSSEEFDSRCDSTCPDDDAARSCCQEMGFATGYCKPYGRAECEGRRSYGRIQTGRGYGRQMPRENGVSGATGGSRVRQEEYYNANNARGANEGSRVAQEEYNAATNNVRGADGGARVQDDYSNTADEQGNSPRTVVVRKATSSRGPRSVRQFWSCDPTCETGGNVNGCCRNHGFTSGYCDEGAAYCSR